MTRDTSKDEAYFTKHIIEWEEEIKEDEKKLLELPLGDARRENYFFSITDGKKCIAIDKYSRGDDINLVKKDLEAYILLKQKKSFRICN